METQKIEIRVKFVALGSQDKPLGLYWGSDVGCYEADVVGPHKGSCPRDVGCAEWQGQGNKILRSGTQ